jgi:hypothetical protein
MSDIEYDAALPKTSADDERIVFRHRLSTRLWHWTNEGLAMSERDVQF